jgi:hypothetical protein
MIRPLVSAALACLVLAGCAQSVAQRPRPVAPRPAVVAAGSAFAEAGDGTVIPDMKPDADAMAFASHCGGGSPGGVQMGMSECELIALKGTPSRVVQGLDQAGNAHNAIWYVEGGIRTVYKFNDGKLFDIIK